MTTKAPRDLGIEKTTRYLYEELQEDWSPFARSKKRFMKDIFLFSALIGYRLKNKKPLEKRDSVIPLSAFSEDERWILKSLAIADRGLEILHNEKELFKIVEEYANGGLETLHNIIYGNQNDPELALEEEIRRFINIEMLSREETPI